jgi:hypothetical protein
LPASAQAALLFEVMAFPRTGIFVKVNAKAIKASRPQPR